MSKLVEDTNLNQVTLILLMDKRENENVIENVIEISEERLRISIPEYSKKKIAKAYDILKLISEKPHISIDEMRKAMSVTDRTIARYLSDLKKYGLIDREGPDNGGIWKLLP